MFDLGGQCQHIPARDKVKASMTRPCVIMWMVTSTLSPCSVPSALTKRITRRLLSVNMAIVCQANISRCVIVVTPAEYNSCN